MGMRTHPHPHVLALYRWTLRLAPETHQREYSDEQVRLFEEIWRDERPTGLAACAVFTLRLVWRSLVAALALRVDEWKGSRRRGRGRWTMGSDVRFTWRSLRSTSWYAGAIVGVIAVTIALAATTFAIVDGVLFKSLPYPEADRLMAVGPGLREEPPTRPGDGVRAASEMLVNTWRAMVPDVGFTGFSVSRTAESGPSLRQDTAGFADVDRNFFEVIGVRPLFGGFADADFADTGDFTSTGRYRPVVLMYDTWQSRFGGDPNVIGRVEMLIEQRDLGLRVVGVMPRTFAFPSTSQTVDFLVPHRSTTASRTNPAAGTFREVVARLPAGLSEGQLSARLMAGVDAIGKLVAAQPPRPGFSIERYDAVYVTPLSTSLARRSKELFAAVAFSAVVLILLTAVNISSLMAARALERRRELEVRRSIGASRTAIVRLWMIEAAILLGAGALIGVLVAAPFLSLVVSLLPESLVLMKAPRIDWRVAGFIAILMSLLCAIVTMAPVRVSIRTPSTGPANGWASERVHTVGRFAVVSGQIAASLVLTTVGASLVGSLMVVYGKERPIRTEGVVVFESRLHGPGGGRLPEDAAERVRRGRILREYIERIPGVTGVGLVEAEVMRGSGSDQFSRPQGVARLPGLDSWGVAGGFFRIVDPILVAGRLPTEEELEAGEPLLVISQRVADTYWPWGGAIGQSLTHLGSKVSHTVVGVIRDVRWHRWDRESPMIYASYARLNSRPFQTFFIRTEVDSAATIRAAVQAVREVDSTVRPRQAATLDELYLESVSLRRFRSWLFGGFAAASLVVVGVGILGLLAMSAARRTKEVGIRCALGATPRSVTGLMVREQLAAVLVGLAAGGVLAAWALGLVEVYLYELTTSDPRIWGTSVALILATAGAGTLIPAIRASRIDPLQALRTE